MSIRLADSFDHYVTADYVTKWNQATNMQILAAGGRQGTACLQTTGVLNQSHQGYAAVNYQSAKIAVGAAVRSNFAAQFNVFALDENNTRHVALVMTTGGQLQAYRNTVLLGTAAVAAQQNVYGFIELYTEIHDTLGVVQVYLDNALVLNLTGQDTRNVGTTGIPNQLVLVDISAINVTKDIRYEDFYTLDSVDDLGDGCVNVLGDVSIRAHYPNGAGSAAEWTRGGTDSGANWSQADEATGNADTDYNVATAVGSKDRYAMQNLIQTGQVIVGVQACHQARKIEAGTGAIGTGFNIGGTNYPAASGVPLGSSYRIVRQWIPKNPATGAGWTESGFNGAEAGPDKTA